MVYSFLAHTAKASTNNTDVTTTAIDTTGANLIVLCTSEDWRDTPVPSDSKTNSWTPLATYENYASGFAAQCTLWYCFNPFTDGAHTFSNIPTGAETPYPSIGVHAFSGAGASPFDQQNGSSAPTGVNTRQPGSITPTQNDELVMAGTAWNGAIGALGLIIDSGFAGVGVGAPDQADSSGTAYGVGIAYLIQTVAGAINPTFQYNISGIPTPISAASIASFKIPSGDFLYPKISMWY